MKVKHHHLRQAFMMLEAILALCVCASAIALAFGFIHTLNANLQTQPSPYQAYKNTLLSPQISNQTLTPLSPSQLVYETQQSSYTHTLGETFIFFTPIQIH